MTTKTPPTYEDLRAEADALDARIDEARAAGDTAAWLQLCHRRDITLPTELAATRDGWLAQQVEAAWADVDTATAALDTATTALRTAETVVRDAWDLVRTVHLPRNQATPEDKITAVADAERAGIHRRQRLADRHHALQDLVEAWAAVGRLEDDGAPTLRPRRWLSTTIGVADPTHPGEPATTLLAGTLAPRWVEPLSSHVLVDEDDAPPVPTSTGPEQTLTVRSPSLHDHEGAWQPGAQRPGHVEYLTGTPTS